MRLFGKFLRQPIDLLRQFYINKKTNKTIDIDKKQNAEANKKSNLTANKIVNTHKRKNIVVYKKLNAIADKTVDANKKLKALNNQTKKLNIIKINSQTNSISILQQFIYL